MMILLMFLALVQLSTQAILSDCKRCGGYCRVSCDSGEVALVGTSCNRASRTCCVPETDRVCYGGEGVCLTKRQCRQESGVRMREFDGSCQQIENRTDVCCATDFSPSCIMPDQECLIPGSLGTEYTGKHSITRSGITCQRWDELWGSDNDPIGVYPNLFPDASKTEAANYCRNPNADQGGLWCPTGPETFESCDVPVCKDAECTVKGSMETEYMGTLSTSRSGGICSRWDDELWGERSLNDPEDFPDTTLAEAANYCRNPDQDPAGVWCVLESLRFSYCEVPTCFSDCIAEGSIGMEYFGTHNVTNTGLACSRWDEANLGGNSWTDPNSFPDDTVADAANYCRNPSKDGGGLWCIIDEENFGQCDVPIC